MIAPVYCNHPKAKPPKGTKKTAHGHLVIPGVLVAQSPKSHQTVVTAPWCQKDHFPHVDA